MEFIKHTRTQVECIVNQANSFKYLIKSHVLIERERESE